MAKKPKSVNILGTDYTVVYCESASDVDVFRRESLQGQVDFWTSSIRVCESRSLVAQWKTVIHEILHAIGECADIAMLKNKDNHDQLDALANILVDTLIRNKFLEIEE